MRLHKLVALVLVVIAPLAARAQNITTVVGGGPVNLPKRTSSLGSPAGVRQDSLGNTYMVDNNFNRLLRIDHVTKDISVIAGTGPFGYNGDDIPAIGAQLAGPSGLCIDSNNNVYIADSDNGLVREYVVSDAGKTTGHLVNVAGVQTETNFTYGGDGGPALSANIHFPDGCSFDTHGNLYIADRGNNAIRVVIGTSGIAPAGLTTVTAGNIYLFAGSTDGVSGVSAPSAGSASDGSVAIGAALNGPFDVFVDPNNNVYVATVDNPPPTVQNPPLVRVIPSATGGGRNAGAIYTVAGGGPGTAGASGVGAKTVPLRGPEGLWADANGNVIFVEAGGHVVREVAGTVPPLGMTAGNIYTIAGGGSTGYSGDGDTALDPRVGFASLAGSFVDGSGNLYVADAPAGVIRIVDGSNADYTLRTIDTYAGNGHVSYADAANATAGELLQPAGIVTSSTGDLIIADAGSSLLRGAPAAGGLITVAGKPEFNGFVGDGGPANLSVVNNSLNLAIDGSNNGYIADTGNCIVRKIDGSGNINTIAGTIPTIPNPVNPEITTPVCGFAGAGGPALSAKFGLINGIAVDSHGNVFFSDATNNIVWEYVVASPAAGQTIGNVYIVVGTQTTTGSFGGDNGPATAAQLNHPTGLFIDSFDNLFLADSANHVVREVPATTANGMTKGDIYTVAGTGTAAGFSGDGAIATAAKLDTPFGIFVDSNFNLFIADTNNQVIREVPSNDAGGKTAGFIYTVAGTSTTPGFAGDGGAAIGALLTHPKGLAQGPSNSLLLADSDNNRIRSVSNLTSSPSLTLSTYALNFPNQPLLLPSTPQPVIITNADNVSLTLTVVSTSITGTNAADFSVTSTCDNKALAASATCTINVTFTPTLPTPEKATLTISDTVGDHRIVALTGTSVPAVPGAQVSPTTLTFSSQVVNTQSAGQNVTLTNTGTGTLTGIAISITTPGANAADFSQSTTCGATLNVGANCTITVKFKPIAAGTPRTATLSIADSAASSPQTVALTGTAVAPGVQLSSNALNFTGVVVNTTSTAPTVTLTNNGTSTLTVSNVATAGGAFTQTNTCTTVAAGANCTISVKFAPTVVGPATGTVTITDDANPTTQTITLTGTAVAASSTVGLSSSSLTFADQLVGTTSATAQTVTVTNNGTASLTISKIAVSAAYSETDTCTAAVPASGTCAISVKFAPTAAGPNAGTITITDNATPATQTVTLSGNGLAPKVSVISSLSFPDQLVGTVSATAQTVTVTNNGTAALTISKVAVSAAYSETDTCTTAAVPANGTCTISVKFAPTAAGANAGTITITDNATPATQTVTLTGNGFTVSLGPASGGSLTATVKAGSSATYNLQFATSATTSTTPISITVACVDPASKSTCNAPATVTLTPGTPSAYTVTVSTTAASMMAPQSEPNSMPPANLQLLQLVSLSLLFCIVTLMAAMRSPALRMRAIRVAVTACLLLMPIAAGSMLTGCASSGGSSSTPPPVVPGTPANTYTVVITPTVGGVAQAPTNLTLIVQ